jgi:hypothetical protein
MNTILEKYNLTFANQITHGFFDKTVIGNNIFATFLSSMIDLDNITQGIQNVDYYLNGGEYVSEKEYVSTEIFSAIIDNEHVSIFYSIGSDTFTPLCIIPLVDFKEVLNAWRDFLLTPPLHGSKIKKID